MYDTILNFNGDNEQPYVVNEFTNSPLAGVLRSAEKISQMCQNSPAIQIINAL